MFEVFFEMSHDAELQVGFVDELHHLRFVGIHDQPRSMTVERAMIGVTCALSLDIPTVAPFTYTEARYCDLWDDPKPEN
jgi:hypothetical protein